MKLIGISRLAVLALDAPSALRGAIAAMHAELDAAEWRGHQDALRAYPSAECSEHRIVIGLDEQHCVVVTINYELSIALIEFAGRRVDRVVKPPTRRKSQ